MPVCESIDSACLAASSSAEDLSCGLCGTFRSSGLEGATVLHQHGAETSSLDKHCCQNRLVNGVPTKKLKASRANRAKLTKQEIFIGSDNFLFSRCS